MKVLILGNGGSGKSYLAKCLAKKIACDPIHLDRLYWKQQWQHASIEEWESALHFHLQQSSWIMEGTPMRDLQLRISHANIIIFLDTPRYLCTLRILKKGISSLKRHSSNSDDGCPVQGISLKTIRWIWSYPRKIKPQILPHFIAGKKNKNEIFYLKNKKEVMNFIKNFTVS